MTVSDRQYRTACEQGPNSLWTKSRGPVAVKMQSRREPNGPEGSARTGTPPILPVGAFRPAPRTAGPRNRTLPPEQKRGDGLERRPPVGTAARRAAGGSLPSAFTGRRHGARSAANGICHSNLRITPNAGIPAENGPPRNWGSFPPPAYGGLCRPEVGVPLPAHRSAWWRTGRDLHIQGLHSHACIHRPLGIAAPGARVVLVVHPPQALFGDVGVDLGGGDRGVAQHLLQAPQVGPALEQVRRKRVPQHVR